MRKFFPHRTPGWVQNLFPGFIWNKPTDDKVVYLTFDDGPVPQATPVVLDYLSEFNARATFFCVGENVIRYPEVLKQVITQGHSVGNHTHHHLNGWSTPVQDYLQDVEHCQQALNPYLAADFKPMMRPPYGRILPKQWRNLAADYQLVMWDVLSGDFSGRIDATTCLKQSIRFTRPGSIVLFHDSIKTIEKLKAVLPAFLKHFSQRGFSFKQL